MKSGRTYSLVVAVAPSICPVVADIQHVECTVSSDGHGGRRIPSRTVASDDYDLHLVKTTFA
jgi:hypothetical protein